MNIKELLEKCKIPTKNELDNLCKELKKKLISMEVDKRNITLYDNERMTKYKMFNCVNVKPKRGKIMVRYNYHKVELLTAKEAKDYICRINNGYFGYCNKNSNDNE